MNNKLTIASRIMAAFGSGALVAVFFLPVWRIDLFAPQYPEGLTMNIWINGLTGQVDIINGLNHYIGMKHITEAMFPEFVYLPYVVGFFMLLGMIISISGSRKILFAYICLTVIGGILAMYDFSSGDGIMVIILTLPLPYKCPVCRISLHYSVINVC